MNAASIDRLENEEFAEDPFSRWLEDPSAEQYRGQQIAIHATLGIVAHGGSLKVVLAQLQAKGIPLDDITLDKLPSETP